MAQTLESIKSGGKGAIARALTAFEQDLFASDLIELLDKAYQAEGGHVLGITGPPGAGKSTLIDALIALWRARGKTVAVLAVDPSSKISGGALLGDRVRMKTDPADTGVFVRSLAARGRLGGLADTAYPAVILLRALFDIVIVESVGVGQSETEITAVCDTTVLCIQPASGDSLQFMKAGVAEIPDIAVVTKADMGQAATRALSDLKGALGLVYRSATVFEPLCLMVSAPQSLGLQSLLNAFEAHRAWLGSNARLQQKRASQANSWIESEILSAFGRKGLALAGPKLKALPANSPFRALRELLARLHVSLQP